MRATDICELRVWMNGAEGGILRWIFFFLLFFCYDKLDQNHSLQILCPPPHVGKDILNIFPTKGKLQNFVIKQRGQKSPSDSAPSGSLFFLSPFQ